MFFYTTFPLYASLRIVYRFSNKRIDIAFLLIIYVASAIALTNKISALFKVELAVAGNATIIATNNLKDLKNAELLFPQLGIPKSEEMLRRQ